MVTQNDPLDLQQDLFGGPSQVEAAVQTVVTPVVASPKPTMPNAATAVPAKVAAQFAMSDLFSELLAVESTRAPQTFINALRDSTIPQAPELGELVESAAPNETEESEDDTVGLALDTDEQLAAEYKAWEPTEEWVLWAHRQKLDEELVFLTSTDVKPRVWKEKAQTLQWIFTVDQIGDKDVREIPFSFHNCCLAAGHRPDDLRDSLVQVPLIRELLVNLRLYREKDLPKLRKKVLYTDFVGEESPEIPDHHVYQFPGI